MSKAMTPDEHRRSTQMARIIYAVIFLSFLSVCTIAVISTSTMERNKRTFQQITVKQPISLFDTTYLKKSK